MTKQLKDAALPALPEPAHKGSEGTCCGNFTTGGSYMGQSEELCCGRPDEAWPDYYTADQMREYAADALRSALAAPQPEQAEPVAVPEIDYTELVEAAWKNHKHARGTGGCIAFKHGAEWFRSKIAAAPQPAEPSDTETLMTAICHAGRFAGVYSGTSLSVPMALTLLQDMALACRAASQEPQPAEPSPQPVPVVDASDAPDDDAKNCGNCENQHVAWGREPCRSCLWYEGGDPSKWVRAAGGAK